MFWRVVKAKNSFEPLSILLRLSLQNMATLAFINLSLFFDRLILAKYSTNALHASVSASSITGVFIFGAISIGSISDMFLARKFGARKFSEMGAILWQMIWFSLLMALAFQLVAIYLTPHLVPLSPHAEEAETYFKWQMTLGFLPLLISVLNSFFIGIKRFNVVLVAVLLAGLAKVICEIPLVHGLPGLFSGLGIKGAVISTAISQCLHLVLLFSLVFTGKNRKIYGLDSFCFKKSLFLKVLRLGLPQALGSSLNYAIWAVVVNMLALAGERQLMMYTIIDSFYILFGFTTEGLQKGIVSLAANMIGSGRINQLPSLLKAAYIILIALLLCLLLPLFVFAKDMAISLDQGILSVNEFSLACLIAWIYLCFDGLGWIYNGLLTAFGDTFFTNPINAFASLFAGAGATFLMTHVFSCDALITCWVTVFYGIFNALLLSTRLRTWKCMRSANSEIAAKNPSMSAIALSV
jgi:MATE family multidrug resistance protein